MNGRNSAKYALVRRSTVNDEITMVMRGMDRSQLHVWALQNTGKQEIIIVEIDSGLILNRYTDQGTADGYPQVENLGNQRKYVNDAIKSLFLSGTNRK